MAWEGEPRRTQILVLLTSPETGLQRETVLGSRVGGRMFERRAFGFHHPFRYA